MAQHKHFELMALFLEDARVSEKPWVFWQYKNFDDENDDWDQCQYAPNWFVDFEYRRKPRTIRIGEFDVPEPMRVAPKKGEMYFRVEQHEDDLVFEFTWCNDSEDNKALAFGMCHATKEAAILHAIALISLTCTPERLAELRKLL